MDLQKKNRSNSKHDRTDVNFATGDEVLLTSQSTQTQVSKKMYPQYIGPFKIIKNCVANTFRLMTMTGRKKPKVENVINLKMYYSRKEFKLKAERIALPQVKNVTLDINLY